MQPPDAEPLMSETTSCAAVIVGDTPDRPRTAARRKYMPEIHKNLYRAYRWLCSSEVITEVEARGGPLGLAIYFSLMVLLAIYFRRSGSPESGPA